MRILFLLIFSFGLFSLSSLRGQFYTLRPIKQSTTKVEVRDSNISGKSSSIDGEDSLKTDKHKSNPSLEGFSLPIDSPIVINSMYGYRSDPFTGKRRFHYGIDLKSKGNTVFSVLGGKVKKIGNERKGLGNYITMKYGDFELTYGHLSTIFVSEKDIVSPGSPIGISGNTGRSSGEHLHLSLRFKGKKTDPLPFIIFIQRRATQQNNITT